MITVSSLIVVLFLSGSAVAQGATREDIFSYLAKDSPSSGSVEAPVTLIEFSDFRCSFCRKFWQTALPLLDKKYISPGKVRFTYRDFAVLGKPSGIAAQAAECAGEQGKLGEYHDKLFASVGFPLAFADGKLRATPKSWGLKARRSINVSIPESI